VESALLATYGVDVLDPAVTLRRIWLLLRRLPPGAWPDADEATSWSVEAYLLANVLDAVADLTWVTVAANSKHKPQRPKPIPRPGKRAAQKPDAGMASLRSAMREVTK